MKIVKLFVGGRLSVIAVLSPAKAQTNSYRTNVLINIMFNLNVYEQVYLFLSTSNFAGPYVPSVKISKVTTDGVIGAVAHQAGITGDLSGTKLYFRLSWTDPNDISRDMIIRKPGGYIMGTNDAVVNGYLSLNFPDTVSVVSADLDGTTNVTDYANLNATLNQNLSGSQGSFNLRGISTLKSGSLFYNGQLIDRFPSPKSFTCPVTGSGSL